MSAFDEEDDDKEWKHDMYDNHSSNGMSGGSMRSDKHRLEPGSSVMVSNLEPDVTEDDVKDIFAQIGNVKSVQLMYNKEGQSQGTAEVTFRAKDDAEKAVTEYNEAEVDGKIMYLKIIADVVAGAPVVVKRTRSGPPRQLTRPSYGARRGRGAPRGGFRRFNNFDGGFDGGFGGGGYGGGFGGGGGGYGGGGGGYGGGGGGYGGGGGGRGAPRRARGRGRGRGRGGRGRGGGSGGKPLSAESLDAEMDDWQSTRGGAATELTTASVNPTAAGQPSLPSGAKTGMEDATS